MGTGGRSITAVVEASLINHCLGLDEATNDAWSSEMGKHFFPPLFYVFS